MSGYVSCDKLAQELALKQDSLLNCAGDPLTGNVPTCTEMTDAIIEATPNATISTRGLVELATAAETVAGEDSERAVTPLGLTAALNAHAPNLLTCAGAPMQLDANVPTCTEMTAAITTGVNTALEVHAPNLLTCAGAPMQLDANVPTCTEMNTAITTNVDNALAVHAPNLYTCAGAPMPLDENVPTCAEMYAAIDEGVSSVILPVVATETIFGLIEIATASEVETTISPDNVAITPAKLAAALNNTLTACGNNLQKSIVNAMEIALPCDAGAQTAVANSIKEEMITALNFRSCGNELIGLNASIATCAELTAVATQAAGGALTGNYPNPGLVPAAVATALAFKNCAGAPHSVGASVPSCTELGNGLTAVATQAAGGALSGNYPNPGLVPAAVAAALGAVDCNGAGIGVGASLATCANLSAAIAAIPSSDLAYFNAYGNYIPNTYTEIPYTITGVKVGSIVEVTGRTIIPNESPYDYYVWMGAGAPPAGVMFPPAPFGTIFYWVPLFSLAGQTNIFDPEFIDIGSETFKALQSTVYLRVVGNGNFYTEWETTVRYEPA